MQLAVFLVIVLPLAMSAPNKERAFSLNPLLQSIMNIFHADEIKLLVTDLIDQLGSDSRKSQCSLECNKLVDTQVDAGTVNTITHAACPMVCTSLQELAHLMHIPHPTPSSATTY
ncbi:uncharacterized protein LOC110445318 [Mizuhopecten yessoensis]|uniref:uncharacterized protein LOC110445318 n=1 Tax=Mizuhopecten yessoensis TaxID=6573 RepID=UPI000B45F5F5|nr:uncharacterized protein LOC110445318 [Mizuhopecten yessoensis]